MNYIFATAFTSPINQIEICSWTEYNVDMQHNNDTTCIITTILSDNIIIENNHIPDGDALGGSGIAINGGVTSINNCILRNNSVGLNFYQLNGGGGILCGFNFSDTPLELTVSNSEIYNNSANIGAAIGALSGNILLDHVLIYNNIGEYGSAISLGEPLGLVVDDINMTITRSTIAENEGAKLSYGLGLSLSLNRKAIAHKRIRNNYSVVDYLYVGINPSLAVGWAPLYGNLSGFVGNIVEVAFRIRGMIMDGGRS